MLVHARLPLRESVGDFSLFCYTRGVGQSGELDVKKARMQGSDKTERRCRER
jgi:hypothetical protein